MLKHKNVLIPNHRHKDHKLTLKCGTTGICLWTLIVLFWLNSKNIGGGIFTFKIVSTAALLFFFFPFVTKEKKNSIILPEHETKRKRYINTFSVSIFLRGEPNPIRQKTGSLSRSCPGAQWLWARSFSIYY